LYVFHINAILLIDKICEDGGVFMAKIIKIDNDIISIGTNDGGIKEVRRSDLNFEPQLGDEVEVFESENTIVVTKQEEKQENLNQGGININLSNTQNIGSEPVYATNNTKAVNKVTYCLLALFLGGIGVHKFYAGKIGLGFLYLIFCWTYVPVIIAFIEFIIALCKPADSNGKILV
jgi:TM2 domain-containing membrane protein YozV